MVVTENPGIIWSYTTKTQQFSQPQVLVVYEHDLISPNEKYVWNETYSECTKLCAGGLN